jgi:hypothetical protein
MEFEPILALFQGFEPFLSSDLNPNPDPHQGEKSDPDPHPNPHQCDKSNLDPHQHWRLLLYLAAI